MTQQHHGGCECGAVRYAVTGPLRDVWNCHCGRCRRFTGHHMAGTAAKPEDVRFEADATLRWYTPHPTAQYGFCSACGSSLFWRATDDPAKLVICAGTLDSPTGLTTTTAWWVAEASDYHVRPDVIEYDYDG